MKKTLNYFLLLKLYYEAFLNIRLNDQKTSTPIDKSHNTRDLLIELPTLKFITKYRRKKKKNVAA